MATLNADGSTQTDSDGNVITHTVPLPFPIKATFLESIPGADTLNVINDGVEVTVSLTLDEGAIQASNMPGTIVYAQSPSTIEELCIELGGGDDQVRILGNNEMRTRR